MLHAHHLSKGLAASCRAPLKANNDGQCCSVDTSKPGPEEYQLALNIRKLYLYLLTSNFMFTLNGIRQSLRKSRLLLHIF